MSRRSSLAALAGALLFRAAAALAQPSPPQEAEREFGRGIEAMQANHYADAVVAFQESYRARSVPMVLYNLALAYRALGQNIEAMGAFQRYLHDAGAEVPAARLTAIQDTIVALRNACGVLPLTVHPAGATVSVDGRPALFGPDGRELLVDPGERVLHLEASGYVSQDRMIRVAAGSRQPVEVTLSEVPVTAAPPRPPPPPPQMCIPGAQYQCACPASVAGVQRCDATGTIMEACVCAQTPPATRRVTTWYGWQVLIVDGASGALALLGLTGEPAFVYVASGADVFGSAIVHWAHRRLGAGFGALGIRLGMGYTGALLGVLAGGQHTTTTDLVTGASIGLVLSWGVDALFFARESHDVPVTPVRPGAPQLTALGALPMPHGGLFTLNGSF